MLSLHNRHGSAEKTKRQHSQIETAPPERVETLVKPGRGFTENVQRHRRPPARSIAAFVSRSLGGRGRAGGVGGAGAGVEGSKQTGGAVFELVDCPLCAFISDVWRHASRATQAGLCWSAGERQQP